ncbi:MAG TPA: hypothetical protein VD902_21935, partial [Symbiobacteriaceae bacterium]|nr:hypothetical protein [Symbiobacteriaceae bacterium]
MNLEQGGIREQVAEQADRSRRTFLFMAWVFGLLVMALLWAADRDGALRVFAVYMSLTGILTVLIFLRWRPAVMDWLIPLAMSTCLVSVTLLADRGYNPWAVYMGALVLSIATRSPRAPLPALGLVLAAAGYNLWSGRHERVGDENLAFTVGLLVVSGLVLYLVAARMTKIARILEGAALQDETVRRLDEAMTRLTRAGAGVSEAAGRLEQGAAGAASQVEGV